MRGPRVPEKNCLQCGKPIPRFRISNRKKLCSAACMHEAKKKDLETCFWAKVNKEAPSGCWEWTASRKVNGYGQFIWRGKMNRAHRLAWKLINGDPGELEVAHKCDNRICVNPSHLFLATHQENMADCVSKGRHTFGEKNKRSKLTPAQVLEIRANPPKHGEMKKLAEKYGVRANHISRILSGAFWKHIV